jgi:hypothetical protein
MTTPAAVHLGCGQPPCSTPKAEVRRSLLRLRGWVCYWHEEDGKPGTWGVVKSDALTKYHVHVSEFHNTNKPEVGQRVEFTPRPPRTMGELRRAVDVFIDRSQE